MKIIFLGTSSGAGKTTITALYCRYLRNKGIRVAPFKASNLALNSFATADGGEIGVGQAFQAWVSGVVPSSDMNPVLLKPLGNGRVQPIVDGKAQDETPGGDALTRSVSTAYERLSMKYDAIVCEGSGSPVELNLMNRDLANIGMMREHKVPAILVGDIERGGVFAALYGTWLLIPDDVRPLLKGFIINRFRGDPALLESAIQKITELTGMEFIGTVPYVDLKFPAEDSLSDTGGELDGPNLVEAFIANADKLLETAKESGLDLKRIEDISSS